MHELHKLQRVLQVPHLLSHIAPVLIRRQATHLAGLCVNGVQRMMRVGMCDMQHMVMILTSHPISSPTSQAFNSFLQRWTPLRQLVLHLTSRHIHLHVFHGLPPSCMFLYCISAFPPRHMAHVYVYIAVNHV